MTSWNTRFTIVALMLASTGIFLRTRAARDVVHTNLSVGAMPFQLGDWAGVDIPLPLASLSLLHGAKVLQRAYFDEKIAGSEVDLYVAYYPNQRAGDRRHLPEDCLAGSGWSTAETGTITVALPGHRPFPANRYFISKENNRQVVLYWFWARARDVASSEWADAYLVFDALRFNRSDDALIRINTPLSPREEPLQAERRLLAFAAQLGSGMDSYLPR
jgi:EpsI family protein